MIDKKIYKCKNDHYFQGEKCPLCGERKVKEYEQRPGDCIYCGHLCPDGAYACNSPTPLDEN